MSGKKRPAHSEPPGRQHKLAKQGWHGQEEPAIAGGGLQNGNAVPNWDHNQAACNMFCHGSQNVAFKNELVVENERLRRFAQEMAQNRSNGEAKQEPPTYESMLPMSATERTAVQELASLGFSIQRTLEVLRKYNGDVLKARSELMIDLRDHQEMIQVDQAREASETSARGDRLREERETKLKQEFGDVLSDDSFHDSLLLDETIGAKGIREALSVQSGTVDLTDPGLRKACIKLLVLEAKCLRWYGVGACTYLCGVANRLNAMHELTAKNVVPIVAEFEKILLSMPQRPGEMPARLIRAFERNNLQKYKDRCGPKCYLAKHDIPVRDDEVAVGKMGLNLGSSSSSKVNETVDLT